jgi:hypothetical protein
MLTAARGGRRAARAATDRGPVEDEGHARIDEHPDGGDEAGTEPLDRGRDHLEAPVVVELRTTFGGERAFVCGSVADSRISRPRDANQPGSRACHRGVHDADVQHEESTKSASASDRASARAHGVRGSRSAAGAPKSRHPSSHQTARPPSSADRRQHPTLWASERLQPDTAGVSLPTSRRGDATASRRREKCGALAKCMRTARVRAPDGPGDAVQARINRQKTAAIPAETLVAVRRDRPKWDCQIPDSS